MREPFYITTPIYYVNDRPHIGHAYTTIAADAAARYRRLFGRDVFFATGTDDHGIKVERSAREHGTTPQAWADQNSAAFRGLWPKLHVEYSDFVRTTEERHRRVAQDVIRRTYEHGDIYKGVYAGWYSPRDEAYYQEDELVDGAAPTGAPVEWVEEEVYFFRLSRYREWFLGYLEAHPEFVQPEARRNEVLSFVRGGLRDLAVSRSTFSWGIPVPFEPSQVIYVWFDALTNYLTVAGYLNDDARFRRYWPADVHLIGKEIVRFHAVYWPIFLHSAGIALPRQVWAHGWLTNEGVKMSKSLGNFLDPLELAGDLARAAGCDVDVAVDALRYFLLREIPFGSDGDVSRAALVGRFNADLANDWGNLASRTLPLVERHFGGEIPGPEPSGPGDADLRLVAEEVAAAVERHVEQFDFSRALAEVWRLLAAANRYLDAAAPWTPLGQGQRARAGAVLYNTLEALRIATVLLRPVLPVAADRISAQLAAAGDPASQHPVWGGLVPGSRVRPGAPIFPRIVAQEPAPASAHEPATPTVSRGGGEVAEVTIDEFRRLDIRVAEVVEAKPVPGADRLIQCAVDIGGERRTIVAGLIPHYRPEDLVGRRIIVLVNLKERMVRGVASRGMLLAAEHDGQIALLSTDKAAPPGARIT